MLPPSTLIRKYDVCESLQKAYAKKHAPHVARVHLSSCSRELYDEAMCNLIPSGALLVHIPSNTCHQSHTHAGMLSMRIALLGHTRGEMCAIASRSRSRETDRRACIFSARNVQCVLLHARCVSIFAAAAAVECKSQMYVRRMCKLSLRWSHISLYENTHTKTNCSVRASEYVCRRLQAQARARTNAENANKPQSSGKRTLGAWAWAKRVRAIAIPYTRNERLLTS